MAAAGGFLDSFGGGGWGPLVTSTLIAKGKTPLAVEKQLDKKTPDPFRLGAHHWLILHGRYVCKARTPECWRCVVADLCSFKPKSAAPKRKS